MPYPQTLEVYQSLQPGDRVEVQHEVKVGFRSWNSTTVGEVAIVMQAVPPAFFGDNFADGRRIPRAKTDFHLVLNLDAVARLQRLIDFQCLGIRHQFPRDES